MDKGSSAVWAHVCGAGAQETLNHITTLPINLLFRTLADGIQTRPPPVPQQLILLAPGAGCTCSGLPSTHWPGFSLWARSQHLWFLPLGSLLSTPHPPHTLMLLCQTQLVNPWAGSDFVIPWDRKFPTILISEEAECSFCNFTEQGRAEAFKWQ